MEKNSVPPKGRLIAGAIVFISGFLSPLFIPLVLNTDLSTGLKTTISGFLALGIPELFMIIAVAILGKQGFEYLKSIMAKWFRKYGPPQKVSRLRYRIGLIMFVIPLVLAWFLPYFGHHIPSFDTHQMWYYIFGDFIFVISLFVLGGEFWDKLKSLFVYSK